MANGLRFGLRRRLGVAYGKEHIQPNSLAQRQCGFGNLVDGVSLDQAIAVDAVDGAAAGVEQAQVIVDFCGRGHGGTRVARGVLLLDRNGRRQTVDLVHIRLLDALQELAGVGGERLDVAPLPLGVDRVEGQRTLPGTRYAADHRQLAVGNLAGDVFQVVSPRAADSDGVIQKEVTGREVGRTRSCPLCEAQGTDGHSSL